VLSADGDGYVYRLMVRKQPGERPPAVTLKLTPPPGMGVTALSVNGSREEAHRARLHFDLSKDYVIEYRLERMSTP
jgi:hypothetical protein